MQSLVIQAGGKSSRMGRDKGLVQLNGKPLVEHLLGRLSGLADEIILVTNSPSPYKYLGLPIVSDPVDKREIGSAQGMITALQAAAYEHVFVVGVDMPLASPQLFERCLSELKSPFVAVMPFHQEFWHPFHGVYAKSLILPLFIEKVGQHYRSVNKILSFASVKAITQLEDPTPLTNINTPADLQLAEESFNTI